MNDCESNEHEPYREKSPECAKPPRDTPNATGHQQHLRDSPPFGRSFFEMTEQYVADSKDHGRDCNRHPQRDAAAGDSRRRSCPFWSGMERATRNESPQAHIHFAITSCGGSPPTVL